MSDRFTPEPTRREGARVRTVRLADGADWGLARPGARLFPKFVTETDGVGRPTEHVTMATGFGYPSTVHNAIDRVQSACEGGSGPARSEAFVTLAASLLRLAHDVPFLTACELVSVSGDDLRRLVGVVTELLTECQRGPNASSLEGPGREAS